LGRHPGVGVVPVALVGDVALAAALIVAYHEPAASAALDQLITVLVARHIWQRRRAVVVQHHPRVVAIPTQCAVRTF
jgi:hypothetical protein